jgi:hypothetical protein
MAASAITPQTPVPRMGAGVTLTGAGGDSWQEKLRQIAGSDGGLWAFLRSTIQLESNGNPGITSNPNTDGTRDRGLLQLNSRYWDGTLSHAKQLDGVSNLEAGTPQLIQAYHAAQAKGLSGFALVQDAWKYGGHPALLTRPTGQSVYDGFNSANAPAVPKGGIGRDIYATSNAYLHSSMSGGISPWVAADSGATAPSAAVKPGDWQVDESGKSYPNPLDKLYPTKLLQAYVAPIGLGLIGLIVGIVIIYAGKGGSTIITQGSENASSN